MLSKQLIWKFVREKDNFLCTVRMGPIEKSSKKYILGLGIPIY